MKNSIFKDVYIIDFLKKLIKKQIKTLILLNKIKFRKFTRFELFLRVNVFA